MRSVVIVGLCLTLLVTVSQANFYGKRAMEGKTLTELLQDMRRQQQTGTEDLISQIEQLIKEYRVAHPTRVLRSADPEN